MVMQKSKGSYCVPMRYADCDDIYYLSVNNIGEFDRLRFDKNRQDAVDPRE